MPDRNWIVCGWFTPDYEEWANRFSKSLESVNAPYDLAKAQKTPGGWEINTMRKAGFILDAIDKHHGKTIIWSDVDAVATGDLSPLADLSCDVALRFQAKRRRGRTWLIPRAGTIVLNPTEAARRLIETWVEASKESYWGDVDETPLAVAIAETQEIAIKPLPSNGPLFSLIAHNTASKGMPKITHFHRVVKWVSSSIHGG